MASHAASAESPASRHCPKRNPGLPGWTAPSAEVLENVNPARADGRLGLLDCACMPGALDPASGSFGMKLMDMRASLSWVFGLGLGPALEPSWSGPGEN